jgi:hypothetical protein
MLFQGIAEGLACVAFRATYRFANKTEIHRMKAIISAYARSPFHFAKKGGLAGVRPDTLAAQVVNGLLSNVDLDPALVEDLICVFQAIVDGHFRRT